MMNKIGDLIKQGEFGDIVLLGFPYDIGVQRNGGKNWKKKMKKKLNLFCLFK